jgi:NADPH:quinone reductase
MARAAASRWHGGAGQIVQLGSETGAWQVGDRVMGRCPGAFSEYALMDVREIMRVPDNLTLEQAASIPFTFLVTYDLSGVARPLASWAVVA